MTEDQAIEALEANGFLGPMASEAIITLKGVIHRLHHLEELHTLMSKRQEYLDMFAYSAVVHLNREHFEDWQAAAFVGQFIRSVMR